MRPRRNGRVVWGLVAAVLVLLVGGVAYALGSRAEDDTAGASSDANAVTPPAASADSSTQSPSSGASSSPSPTDGPDAKVAAGISALLADSIKNKTDIAGAVNDLDACRDTARAVKTFDAAAASRTGLASQARRLDVGALDGAAGLVDQLTRAWTASAKADRAFAAWGRSMHRTKKGCKADTAALRRATDLSVQSHAPKQAAAKAWRPIARKYGLPAVGWKQL